MVMIIFSLTVFFSFKVPSFILFCESLCFFPGSWWLIYSLLFGVSSVYIFYFLISFIGVVWVILWVWFDFLWSYPLGYVNLCFLWFWLGGLFFLQIIFLVSSILLLFLLYHVFRRVSFLFIYTFKDWFILCS
jgi:hypothetical protein